VRASQRRWCGGAEDGLRLRVRSEQEGWYGGANGAGAGQAKRAGAHGASALVRVATRHRFARAIAPLDHRTDERSRASHRRTKREIALTGEAAIALTNEASIALTREAPNRTDERSKYRTDAQSAESH
jgi:hypothetical protein